MHRTSRQIKKSAPHKKSGRVLPALLIVLAGITVYSNTFAVPFLFDDEPAIVINPKIRSVWPTVAMQGSVRGVAIYTFALNYMLHGLDARGYHVLNLAIHIAAVLCLYGIVRRTLIRVGGEYSKCAEPLALAIALIWVVHPLQTQAVTYIVQRLESLMGLAYLATVYCFIRALDSKRAWAWYLGSVVACALGMGCKEVIVSAPLIVLWYDRAFVANSWRQIAAERKYYYVALAASWGVLAGLIAWNRAGFSSAVIVVEGLNPWIYLMSQASVIVHYLRLSIWPSGQCFDYAWPATRTLGDALPA